MVTLNSNEEHEIDHKKNYPLEFFINRVNEDEYHVSWKGSDGRVHADIIDKENMRVIVGIFDNKII